ncbi:MAG: c-type cytochrome [Syntrophomonadaceae bacterium]
MRFLGGIVFGVVLVGAAAAAFVFSGAFDVAASVPPGALEKRLAGFARDRSVAHRASSTPNPLGKDPAALRDGGEHYKEMCVTCHGAPGVDSSEIGEGLNPPAPDLTLARIQARSDGELFWIVQNGIRMSGMPAFGPTHKDREIWAIVAFLRHLPSLSPEEEKALAAATREHEKD